MAWGAHLARLVGTDGGRAPARDAHGEGGHKDPPCYLRRVLTGSSRASHEKAGPLAEAWRWYAGTWKWQAWGPVLAGSGLVAAMVCLDVLFSELGAASGRGETSLDVLGAHPWLATLALGGMALWTRLELLPDLRTMARGARLRLLARLLLWCAALWTLRWPGVLDPVSAHPVWAATLLADAALSYRRGWGWVVWAVACVAAAAWLLAW